MSSAVVFVLVCCMNAKKTLFSASTLGMHKACLTALHVICLQISRHHKSKIVLKKPTFFRTIFVVIFR